MKKKFLLSLLLLSFVIIAKSQIQTDPPDRFSFEYDNNGNLTKRYFQSMIVSARLISPGSPEIKSDRDSVFLPDIFTIFPNPATTVINIRNKGSEPFGEGKVSLKNSMGVELMNQDFNGKEAQLKVGDLAFGVYFVDIISNSCRYTYKVIISK